MKLAGLRVWIDKGWRWSSVDRLVVWALAEQPQTASELAAVAGIPSRLVIEIILRMMRFGWIEFGASSESKRASFHATDAEFRSVVDALRCAI